MPESFLNKVVDLSPAYLLKKRLSDRCFPVNFAKFSRIVHLRWLFLKGAMSVRGSKLYLTTKFADILGIPGSSIKKSCTHICTRLVSRSILWNLLVHKFVSRMITFSRYILELNLNIKFLMTSCLYLSCLKNLTFIISCAVCLNMVNAIAIVNSTKAWVLF